MAWIVSWKCLAGHCWHLFANAGNQPAKWACCVHNDIWNEYRCCRCDKRKWLKLWDSGDRKD